MSTYLEQGEVFLEKKEYTKAMEFFQAAIDENPNREEGYLKLSETYYALKKDREAESTLYKLLSIDPACKPAQNLLRSFLQSNIIKDNALLKNTEEDINKEKTTYERIDHARISNSIRVSDKQKNTTKQVHAEQLSGNVFRVELPWGVRNIIYVEKLNSSECIIVPPIGNQNNALTSATDCWGGFEKPHGQVTISDTIMIDGGIYKVTIIGDGAFSHCSHIVKIVLPNTIKQIGHYAFHDTSVRNVQMPDSVYYLYSNAFSCCKQLKEVSLSNNLKQLPNKLFVETSIEHMEIPKSIYSIGDEFLSNKKHELSLRMHCEPPNITERTFYSILSGRIYVPMHFLNMYKNSSYWGTKNLIPY